MLRRMVGSSLKLRPVAPGPPQNSVSPDSTRPSAASWKQQHPGEWPGVWITPRVWPPAASTEPGSRSRSGSSLGWTASHSMRSSGCSSTGASTASRSATAALMWSLWPWVHTMATTRRPPTAAAMGSWSWAASKISTSRWSPTSQMLLVTSHSPPSRAKMPSVVTSSMGTASVPVPPTARQRSAAPRPVPSCGRPPPRPRGRSSRTRNHQGLVDPAGTGRSASGSPGSAGSRRTSST